MVAKRTLMLSCVAVLAIAAGGCSTSGSGPHTERAQDATATVPATTTTADPQAADKAAVLAAYQGYYTTFQEAWGLNSGQPHQTAQIADYASDAALDAAVNFVETLVQNHRTVRGPQPEHTATVRCVHASTAVVDDDVVDHTNTYEANGQQVSSGPGSAAEPARQHTIALLRKRRSDSRWAVTQIGPKDKACAE